MVDDELKLKFRIASMAILYKNEDKKIINKIQNIIEEYTNIDFRKEIHDLIIIRRILDKFSKINIKTFSIQLVDDIFDKIIKRHGVMQCK